MVSTVEHVRFRPRVSASKHTLSHYRSWAASLTEEAPLVVLHNDALISDGEKMNDPAMQLLFSFGYETFDYTKDKQVPAARPAPELAPLLDDILFGRLGTDEPESAGDVHLSMYG